MTTDTALTTSDNNGDNHNRINVLNNLNSDKLHNPSTLYEFLVCVSMAFLLVMPAAYFALSVYPTMTAYSKGKAQLVSIPSLSQQLEQLKQRYKNSHTALLGLEADISSAFGHDATAKQYNSLDLHRLAHKHRLTIVAMDTLSEQPISPHLADHFTIDHLSWQLRGYFPDYLEFRKAVRQQQPLLQTIQEHLSAEENLKLNIVVDLNIYRPIDVAL
ncbi:MAG: hypothetical protein GDA45_06105 [Chromatiales bacterium]|nr:hypothetical protein [Chromatiales bacterium]